MVSSVFVINSSNPELDHLAADLSGSGDLDLYIRRYANKQRWPERFLAKFAPSTFKRTLGKRTLPAGLDPDRVSCAGTEAEVLTALAHKLPGGRRLVKGSSWERVDRSIAERASTLLKHSAAGIVVGNYGISMEAFDQARAGGRLTVLNYPIAHHLFTSHCLEEEAQLAPEFASTLALPTHSQVRISRENREIELADRIWVGSQFVKRTFEQAGVPAAKIDTIPYGTDLSIFHSDTDSRSSGTKIRAIFAGQHVQRKGLSYLLAAACLLRGKGVEFVSAGYMPKPELLAKYREELTTFGSLDRRSLADEFRRADAFVFPTLIEGLPLVVVEAMATGLPVITTDRGAGEIVRDGVDGFLIPIRNPEAIVEKLELLRDNVDLRLEMGKNARRRAQEFSWANYRRTASACLEMALQGNSLQSVAL